MEEVKYGVVLHNTIDNTIETINDYCYLEVANRVAIRTMINKFLELYGNAPNCYQSVKELAKKLSHMGAIVSVEIIEFPTDEAKYDDVVSHFHKFMHKAEKDPIHEYFFHTPFRQE